EAQAGLAPYAPDGRRFLGATFDPTALYRLLAVLDWLDEQELTPDAVHAHAHEAKDMFLEGVTGVSLLDEHALLLSRDAANRGNFLAFRTEAAPLLHSRLAEAGVVADYRDDRLRFGFGLYHEERD